MKYATNNLFTLSWQLHFLRARPPQPSSKDSIKDQFLTDNQPGVYLTVPTVPLEKPSAEAPDDTLSEVQQPHLQVAHVLNNTEQSRHLTARRDGGVNGHSSRVSIFNHTHLI